MITIGQKLDTSFTLDVVKNGVQQTVPFSALLDKPLVVSVYMKNNTGSCDKQNQSLAEHSAAIAEKGYQVLAISKDTCGSHKKYADKLGITYMLASDPDNRFAHATDSMVEKSMYGKTYMAPSRSAFIIGTDGTVKAIIEKVDTANHAQEVLNLIATL